MKAQYDALASSGLTDEQTQNTLQVMYAQITEGDAQIEAARAQLDEARGSWIPASSRSMTAGHR